jgi:hypothetical protein
MSDSKPPLQECDLARHLILSAKIRNALQSLGYDQEDWAPARKLLASTFEGKTSLRQLSFAQLTEYAHSLQELEDLKRDAENHD